jgi:predicted nucleic acid-binding Zn ribbon protein
MSFQSIQHILVALENQPEWEKPQGFRRLLACWPEIVSSKVASQTRPISISREVLWVATSSSALANTLTLQRYSLLKKLNTRLSTSLVDIRFSTAQWQNNTQTTNPLEAATWQDHPSSVTYSPIPQPPECKDPIAAFQQWADSIQARSQHLPLCPQCQCSTPSGEIQRWGVCGFCATQQWCDPHLP